MKRMLLVVLLGLPMTVFAADWPQFRGPNSQGFSAEKFLPETFSPTEGVKWKAPMPGRGVASPVVVGERVFTTASSGPRDNRLHVYCFDLKSGKELWHRQLTATGSTFCHPDTCMAAPTPVADKDGVYALFATGDLIAFDNEGNLKWYRSLASDYPDISNQLGMASSPVLYQDLLFVPMDNAGDSFLAAIDTRYGKNVWKVSRPRDINWVTPFIRETNGKAELVFQADDSLTSYNIRTGDKLWTYKGQGIGTIPSAFPVGERIYLPVNGLTALDVKKGEPSVTWASAAMRTGMSSSVFYEDKLYGVNQQGVLMCVDAKDGKQLWTERLKGKFSSSPIAADGKVYVGNEAGSLFVVKLGETPELISENKLGDRIQATPAIAGRCVIVRTDNFLYCFGN